MSSPTPDTPRRRQAFGLRQRLLVVVLAPLAFQTVISIVLGFQLYLADNSLKAAVHKREILSRLDDIQEGHTRALLAAFGYSMSKHKFLLSRYTAINESVDKHVKELQQQTADEADNQRDANQLERTITAGRDYLKVMLESDILQYWKGELGPDLQTKVEKAFDAWLNPLGDYFHDIRSKPQSSQALKAVATDLKGLMELSSILSISLAVFLAVWVTRGLFDRLKHIYIHVDQINNEQPIDSVLTGEDEIAELDQTLSKAAERLKQLRTFKTDVTAAVSHDLRSPLTAIQTTITLCIDQAFGSVPEAVSKQLAIARKECQALAALVEDLLDLEKTRAGKMRMKIAKIALAELVESLMAVEGLNPESIRYESDDLDTEIYCDLSVATRALTKIAVLGDGIQFTAASEGLVVGMLNPVENASYRQEISRALATALLTSMGAISAGEVEAPIFRFPSKPTPTTNPKPSAPSKPLPSRLLPTTLGLAVTPTVICCAILWMLSSLIDASDRQIHEEARSYQIIHSLSVMRTAMIRTAICTVGHNFLNTTALQNRRKEYQKTLQTEMDNFDQLVATDAAMRNSAISVRAHKQHLVELAQKQLRLSREEAKAQFDNMFRNQQLPQDLFVSADEPIREQEKLLLKNRLARVQTRQAMLLVLLGGTGLVAIYSMIAHAFLSNTLTKRIEAAIKNADALDSSGELTVPADAHDELGAVEKHLYATVIEVRDLSEQRRQFMDALRQQMQQPIDSMNTIMIEVFKQSAELPAKAQERLVTLKNELNRLLTLVMDLNTAQTGKMTLVKQQCRLDALFCECVAAATPLAEAYNITLRNEPTRFSINADRAKVLQVLINLINNAIKFTPSGGDVNITATENDRVIRIAVTDSGKGVPEQEQEKIFQRFEQSDNAGDEGKGLGLHICKMIVEAHGGTIGVDSIKGEGSCFWFCLPAI